MPAATSTKPRAKFKAGDLVTLGSDKQIVGIVSVGRNEYGLAREDGDQMHSESITYMDTYATLFRRAPINRTTFVQSGV